MKTKMYLIYFVFLMLLVPSFVSADCTVEEKERLDSLLNKVEIAKEYIPDAYYDGLRVYNAFTITLLNMTDEIYAYDESTQLYYMGKIRDNDNKIIFPIYEPGAKNIILVAGNNDCAIRRTKTIVIPTFNNYSLHPNCKDIDIQKFKYCDPWYQGNIDYDEFFVKLAKYKTDTIEESDNDKNSDDAFFTNFSNFVNKYFWYLIGIGIIAFITLCTSMILRKRGNKDEFKK